MVPGTLGVGGLGVGTHERVGFLQVLIYPRRGPVMDWIPEVPGFRFLL